MQHHVTDETGQRWVVDEKDRAGYLWVEMKLPTNGLVIPKKLLVPYAEAPSSSPSRLPLKQTDAMNDGVMWDAIKAAIFRRLNEL